MKILIAGSHGMVGSAVTRHLIECGYEVFRLVRQTPGPGEVWWNPDIGEINTAGLEGFDGVVHLATRPWPMRWTVKAKEKMRANRLGTNHLLAESLAGCRRKPRALVCASGMGYYPSSGDTVLTEASPVGTSFLARLQQDGEAATAPASEAGIRVVHLRIPAVLGGPALQRVGFQTGDGQQWMSWVGRDELASIIEFALTTETLSGPVNAVSPNPLRNIEFATASTRALGQKPGGVMPAFIVRLVMGEMGEELLLASRRMQPAKLLAAGYRFRYPELDCALQHEREVANEDLTPQPA
ncbi:MAG TPA: TIGR01777 family oxidoreductase [Anaerolineales bacterium]|nr:TIGR01777 family oxidoreductase [Anaerolineales bacterium]